jgi:methyltransferase (TIGR00027 family)
MDPIARTSLYTAMLRAQESARPDRLFVDPFAELLAGSQGTEILAWMEARAPGISQGQAVPIRTRYYDDTLERILARPGIDQLIILAAGLDTRAFRLPLPSELALFELDRAEVLELKAKRLAGLNAVPRCRPIPIPADLAGDWSAALHDGGFDRQRPAIWLVEGLLYYLTETEVHHLLATLSELAAPGSWLLADVVGQSFLTSPYMAGFLATMAENGSPWRFGTDDPEGLMTRYGWHPHVTQFGENGANFGRWTLPVTDRADPDLPRGYLVVANC